MVSLSIAKAQPGFHFTVTHIRPTWFDSPLFLPSFNQVLNYLFSRKNTVTHSHAEYCDVSENTPSAMVI